VAAEKYVHETELWEKEVLQAQQPVVVAYYNPTDMSGTEKVGMVDRFVRDHKGLALVKVDATRNELVGRRYNIDLYRLPRLHLFINGEVKREADDIDEASLEALVKSL
jgi:thioredoxin reductase (NADPH)